MFKYFIIIFLLFNISLRAEIVEKVVVSGNDRISTETIIVYGEINLKKDYSIFDINNLTKNLYETDFFRDIKISLNNGILNINVKEYPVINSVDMKGEPSTKVKETILKELKLKSKESFIESKMSDDINKIKEIYASIGFNFTDVDSKIEKFTNNRINLIYSIKKGVKNNIAKINFIGDKKIKERRLKDIIVSEEHKFWKFLSKNTFLSYNNIELDKRLIINYYKSSGYYDVQVLSNNAEIGKNNETILTYTIVAGERYRINKISTNVSSVFDKKVFIPLKKNYSKILGSYYSPFKVKKLLDDLDILIVSNDLQFVEHSVNEILENGNIEIKINIFEGSKQIVEKINIIGNTVTEEAVIRAELLLDEGDPFSVLKMDQSIAKIQSRNLFGVVDKTITDGATPDQKIINITVEEKPTGEISAGAGVGTAGGSLAFNITENNWMGKGVNVSTFIDVSAETFSGGIDFTNPNYNYSGNMLRFYAQNTTTDKKDSGYKNNIITTGIGTKFEQYRNIYVAPAIALSYDDLTVQSSSSESLKKQKGTFTDLSLDYTVSLDNRDRAYAPTDGYVSSFSQVIPVYADAPFIKNTYAFNQYKSFTKDAIGSFKFFTTAINGLSDKDVRLSKRVRLGSSRLRGFEAGKIGPKDGKDYIGGNYAWSTNFEVSLPNLLPESTKIDVSGFIDAGNIWNVDYDKGLNDSNKIRSSAGINTSWVSPVGPMTFIFSQNITKANTDVTESFNFKLGTTF